MQIDEKKGLTKRETVMIILMLVVGFTAAMVVFVIIPLYETLQDERDMYNALSLERMQIDALLLTEPSIRDTHSYAVEWHEEISELFISEAHSSEIGRMLTRLCEEHGLPPIDQRMSNPVAFGDAFLFMTVDMTVSGTYQDLKRLMDTVEHTEYLRIARVSFNLGGDDAYRLDRISLSFEVTMIRDLVL